MRGGFYVMDLQKRRDRLKEIFELTIESDLNFDGNIKNIDYYGVLCKAASHDKLFKFANNNLCMLNCKLDDSDAVIMIFSVAINSPEEIGAKNIAERVMEVVSETEKCFTTLDFVKSEEVKEDKFIYIVGVKKIE